MNDEGNDPSGRGPGDRNEKRSSDCSKRRPTRFSRPRTLVKRCSFAMSVSTWCYATYD